MWKQLLIPPGYYDDGEETVWFFGSAWSFRGRYGYLGFWNGSFEFWDGDFGPPALVARKLAIVGWRLCKTRLGCGCTFESRIIQNCWSTWEGKNLQGKIDFGQYLRRWIRSSIMIRAMKHQPGLEKRRTKFSLAHVCVGLWHAVKSSFAT